MTGIERLRQMAEDFKNVKTAEHCTFIVNTWRGRYIDDAIADIADQIERETQPKRDPAADVSVSAYDLLPPEDREAIAWVREHGGLERVKAQRRESMPHAAYERKKAGFLGHIAECETALGRRREIISELGHRVSDLTRENAERGRTIRELSDRAAKQSDKIRVMRDVIAETCARLGIEGTGSTVDDAQVIWREISRRLMPEGMEWPTVDGKPVDFVTGYEPSLGVLEAVSIYNNGACEVMGHDGIIKDVREIHVATPKVLDADGVEIREKCNVWWICEGDERGVHAERLRVETICPNGLIECSPYNGGTWVYLEPSELYVNKPVPASDGKPLREGEMVYSTENGDEFTVIGIDAKSGDVHIRWGYDFEDKTGTIAAEMLTHERPETRQSIVDEIGEEIAARIDKIVSAGRWN